MAIRARRRHLKLRQIEVAKAARVGREWLVDLEHGKPTVELGLVMRTLQTLGLELNLRATEAPPPWTVPLTAHWFRVLASRAAERRAEPVRKRRRGFSLEWTGRRSATHDGLRKDHSTRAR